MMAKHPANELLDALFGLVVMWSTSQRSDGKTRPLVGCLNLHDLNDDAYVVKGMTTGPARLPMRSTRFPLWVVEDLIHLGYLIPTDGPRAITYLHPTTDALFLADVTTRQVYLPVFHLRYMKLRSTKT